MCIESPAQEPGASGFSSLASVFCPSPFNPWARDGDIWRKFRVHIMCLISGLVIIIIILELVHVHHTMNM